MKYPAFPLMLLGIVLLSFSACYKYDEGPAFSLRTKYYRAARNWRIENATKNGVFVTGQVRIGANLRDNGSLVFTDTIATANGDSIVTYGGVWEFDNDAENLLLVFTNPGGGTIGARIWYILRLTSDELWVTEEVGPDLYRYEFVEK